MKSRLSNATDQFRIFFRRVDYWLWETIEHILLIVLDCLTRLIELTLVVMNLLFQMICFFRDLCIDAMQTFANTFRGIVNVISNISCEEVEDFASACIVVILCTGTVRMLMNFLKKTCHTWRGTLNRSAWDITVKCDTGKPRRKNQNPHAKLFNMFEQQHVTQNGSNNNNTAARHHGRNTCPPLRKTGRRAKRRNNRRYRNIRKN